MKVAIVRIQLHSNRNPKTLICHLKIYYYEENTHNPLLFLKL